MRVGEWGTAFIVLALLLAACGADASVVLDEALFHDEFVPGQTGNWLVEGDEAARSTLLGEQLLIEVDTPQLIHFVTLADPTFTDFVLEVDATQLAGDLESSYGVLFRMQSQAQFYRFEITGSGMYMMERRNADGTWTRFFDDWRDSPAIKQGLNRTNRLKVVAEAGMLSFYVNDMLLQQATDSSYATGTIGLDAGTFGQAGLQVLFDNVVVKRP